LVEWNELAEYGKEQDMGIEALEAMLMDDEFRGAPPFLSFWYFQSKQTSDMQWQKFILARVALILVTVASRYQYLHRLGWLAVRSSWCCVFSLSRSLVMFLCYAPLVVLFWILSSISFVFSGKRRWTGSCDFYLDLYMVCCVCSFSPNYYFSC